MPKKRLYKSRDKMVDGVVSGVVNYLNLDVDITVVRIIVAIAIVLSGFFPGIIIYGIMAVMMPNYPKNAKVHYNNSKSDWSDF